MQKSFMMKSYSEDSICSDEGMIIMKQFKRMVVMIMSENMGWTWMWMATRRTGLNGDKNQSASVAENLTDTHTKNDHSAH